MDESDRREVLSKLGVGAAAFLAATAARAAFADVPGAARPIQPPPIRFNRLRSLKFTSPHGCGPGEFVLTTRATRDGLVLAGLAKGGARGNAGFLGQGMHSVHVKVNSDCSIELTGLDDILNASGPCPPSGGGGTTPFSPATLAPATVATAVATGGQPAPCNQCTDAHGNCIPCPPSGGGSKY